MTILAQNTGRAQQPAWRLSTLLRFARVAVCLALASCSKQPAGHAEQALCPGCNVILISMDTVRADHMGTYGYAARPTTPNVDAFAARAAVFEHAVSQAAWTLPGHGAMMTGLYPRRLGVTRYPANRVLPSSAPTLAGVLQRAGYATAGFTGGGFVSRHFGFDRGFGIYASDGRRFEHNIEETLAWLSYNDKRRFFLFVHGYDAHRPYFSHREDKHAVGVAGTRPHQGGFCTAKRRGHPGARKLKEIIAYYDAAIRMGDRHVGRILDTVRDRGLMDNTVILITSDHGEEFFEHGRCDHVRFVYHEIVHVPYILHVPGVTDSGKRIADVIPASISVAQTLLELVGVENEMPGTSVVPFLTGKGSAFGAVFSEADSRKESMGSRGPTVAMTGDRYKLITYPDERVSEVYDLREDPREQNALSRAHELYAQSDALISWRETIEPLPKTKASAARAATDKTAAASDGAASDASTPAAAAKDTTPATGPQSEAVEDGTEEDGAEMPEDLKEQLRSLGYAE